MPIYPFTYNNVTIESYSKRIYEGKTNNTGIFHLNYQKHSNFLKSDFSILAGSELTKFQDSLQTFSYYMNQNGAAYIIAAGTSTHNNSFHSLFAKFNWDYDGKYLLSATIRKRGNMNFSSNQKWQNYPSIGVAWNIEQESFLNEFRNNGNSLKVRLNTGKTGYFHILSHYSSDDHTTYNYSVLATTKDINAGIEFEVFNQRLSGGIDIYRKVTNGLLNFYTDPYKKYSGNYNNDGLEFYFNATPVHTRNLKWEINVNGTIQKQYISNLPDSMYFIFPPNENKPNYFQLRNQGYDITGKPLEGQYVDLNSDGIIDYKDYYTSRSAIPDFLFALNSTLYYKKISVGFSMSASIGNFVYNKINAVYGNLQALQSTSKTLNNLPYNYINTGFKTQQSESDYYVENASFLKMDNLNIGYDFGKIAKTVKLKLTATVQNVFTLTKYSGVDPEIPGGVDYGFYPRPRIYSVGLNLEI